MSAEKLLEVWLDVGTRSAVIAGAALTGCVLVPVFGWFIGVPVVLMLVCIWAAIWVLVAGTITTTATVYRFLKEWSS